MKSYKQLEDEMIAEFRRQYADAYKDFFSKEVLLEGNVWFEDFLRTHARKIAEAAAESGLVEEKKEDGEVTITGRDGRQYQMPAHSNMSVGFNAARSQSLAQIAKFFSGEQK